MCVYMHIYLYTRELEHVCSKVIGAAKETHVCAKETYVCAKETYACVYAYMYVQTRELEHVCGKVTVAAKATHSSCSKETYKRDLHKRKKTQKLNSYYETYVCAKITIQKNLSTPEGGVAVELVGLFSHV